MTFYENFNKICEVKKISKQTVCRECGLSQGIHSKWKNEQSLPKIDSLLKIVEYLNVSADYLLGLDDIPNRKEEPRLSELTDIEKECLSALNKLTDRDKIEFISRMEQRAEDYSLQIKDKPSTTTTVSYP